VPAVDGVHVALEPAGQTHRVTEQGDPLRGLAVAAVGELLGLGEGQDRLAAAGAAAHVDPVNQPGHAQDRRLLDRQPVGA
jgi:hypothetical protein